MSGFFFFFLNIKISNQLSIRAQLVYVSICPLRRGDTARAKRRHRAEGEMGGWVDEEKNVLPGRPAIPFRV